MGFATSTLLLDCRFQGTGANRKWLFARRRLKRLLELLEEVLRFVPVLGVRLEEQREAHVFRYETEIHGVEVGATVAVGELPDSGLVTLESGGRDLELFVVRVTRREALGLVFPCLHRIVPRRFGPVHAQIGAGRLIAKVGAGRVGGVLDDGPIRRMGDPKAALGVNVAGPP